MARQQNTVEKLRREMAKKRKAQEKMERKRAARRGDEDATPAAEDGTSEYAARKQATRKMSDADILRMARNMR